MAGQVETSDELPLDLRLLRTEQVALHMGELLALLHNWLQHLDCNADVTMPGAVA